MNKPKQVTPAPNWTAIFERRPDLKPPGYEETVAQIQLLKQSNGKVQES